MNDMPDMGRQVLASQPFSVLLGAELVQFAESQAELKVPIHAELTQQHGFVHGGVVSYAADNALTYAGGSVLGVNVVTTSDLLRHMAVPIADIQGRTSGQPFSSRVSAAGVLLPPERR
jgi:uncharacterized protein (TIGR00369 family)